MDHVEKPSFKNARTEVQANIKRNYPSVRSTHQHSVLFCKLFADGISSLHQRRVSGRESSVIGAATKHVVDSFQPQHIQNLLVIDEIFLEIVAVASSLRVNGNCLFFSVPQIIDALFAAQEGI